MAPPPVVVGRGLPYVKVHCSFHCPDWSNRTNYSTYFAGAIPSGPRLMVQDQEGGEDIGRAATTNNHPQSLHCFTHCPSLTIMKPGDLSSMLGILNGMLEKNGVW